MRRTGPAGSWWLFCLLVLAARVQADEPPPTATEARPKYIRLERDEDDEPVALQTSVIQFVPDAGAKPELAGVTVDLIGAVHIGEKNYYETLNKLFERYDVVLYEMVAAEGARVGKGAKPSGHPVAFLQNGLKDMLELEHQLEYIDYQKENLVHADMSPEEFAQAMKDRNESFATMFFKMMGQAMAKQAQDAARPQKKKKGSSDIDLFAALFDKDRAGSMKRIMAEQFENMDGMLDALGGAQGSAIITERNKVALAKLSDQLAAGKKKVAIFYGAGHLSDMEKHLVADFHLKRGNESWITAWKLTKPAPKAETPEDAAPEDELQPGKVEATPRRPAAEPDAPQPSASLSGGARKSAA